MPGHKARLAAGRPERRPVGMRPSVGPAPTRRRELPPQQRELCLILKSGGISIPAPSRDRGDRLQQVDDFGSQLFHVLIGWGQP